MGNAVGGGGVTISEGNDCAATRQEGFMKIFVRHWLATGAGIALAMGGGAAVYAQSQSGSPQPQASPTQAQPQPQSSGDSAAGSTQAAQPQHKLEMVPAHAELSKTLDTKKAKQGDVVNAKLEESVQIPNAQELPKNTVLEGHVDQVTASANKSDSTMVVTFDKAKLKDGQELPIKATVIGLSEPVMAAADQGGGAPAGGGMMGAGGGGGAPSGGGAPAGGTAGGGGGSAARSSGSSSESQPAMNPGATGTSSQHAQSGGVPDVQVTSSVRQHSSVTLTSKGKNVHVPDGTQMQVAITVIPAGVQVP
jgi:hypothetical protein